MLDGVGERPAAAAGGTARSNDGAVGRWMGISSAQSVTTCCHFVYFVLHLWHFLNFFKTIALTCNVVLLSDFISVSCCVRLFL